MALRALHFGAAALDFADFFCVSSLPVLLTFSAAQMLHLVASKWGSLPPLAILSPGLAKFGMP